MRHFGGMMKMAVGALAAGLILMGCSTSGAFVNYDEHKLYSTNTVGNVPYVEIGPVTARQRGHFWHSCDQLTNTAAKKLHAMGDGRGATHVINVRWLDHADGSFSEQPLCTTGWGWFAAAGVGGFMSWVKVAEAHGSLATVDLDGLAGAEALGRERTAEHASRVRIDTRARREAQARAVERAEAEALRNQESDNDEG